MLFEGQIVALVFKQGLLDTTAILLPSLLHKVVVVLHILIMVGWSKEPWHV
jgi:hypothetical protein